MPLSPLIDIHARSEPWARFTGIESAKAYSGFAIYRDLGSARTLAESYRRYSGRTGGAIQPPGYFRDWYEKYVWKERGEYYDDHLDDTVRSAVREAYRESFDTLAKSSRLHVGVLIQMASGRRSVPEDLPGNQMVVGESTQLAAARDALDRLGVKAPDRIESGRPGETSPLTAWVDLLSLEAEDDE